MNVFIQQFHQVVIRCDSSATRIRVSIMSKPLKIQQAIKISGADLPRPITIASTFYESCEGTIYVSLAKKHSFVEGLLLSGTDDEYKGRRLAKTDIIEQLIQARHDKVLELVDGDEVEEVAALLAATDSEKTKARLTWSQKKELPESFVIKTPRIGDVAGIEMRIKAHANKSTPMFVELTPNNVIYLRAASKHQYNEGDIKNPSNVLKHTLKRKRNDEDESEGTDVEEGVDEAAAALVTGADEATNEIAHATDNGGKSSNMKEASMMKQVLISDVFNRKK